MVFKGIKRSFSLKNEDQYNTIGAFWDEMAAIYGLERLLGLGYHWEGETMDYAIGLADGEIDGFHESVLLPDDGWTVVRGRTDSLKELYDEIYRDGALTFEIERFYENGDCSVAYYRE